MEEFQMPMCPKEIGKGENVSALTIARQEHQAVLSRLMSGPGDSEGAMHRAESLFGLSYWSQHTLRHKHRASFPFMARVHAAYVAMLERSVRRDMEALKIEQAKKDDDADLARLVAEAEALLAEIEKRRLRK
jgi:hypothetical protein